eukprot:c9567_g1_i1.p1 GENE.c9567_g1_i1~~c9567_g1_i1.p1  ORF type:complete len:311 (-),score=104.92 c9567_g1_i1:45-920(-)
MFFPIRFVGRSCLRLANKETIQLKKQSLCILTREIHFNYNQNQSLLIQNRFFSSNNTNNTTIPNDKIPPNGNQEEPILTFDMAWNVSNILHGYLQDGNAGKELDKIKSKVGDDSSISARWREMMNIVKKLQLHCIVPYGYQPDLRGLKLFNNSFSRLLESDPRKEELKVLEQRKWDVMLRRAFQLKQTKRIDLNQAREYTEKVAEALGRPEFVAEVIKLKGELTEKGLKQYLEEAVLGMMVDEQMKWMGKYGFEGEEGYIQMQHALLEHVYDPEVSHHQVSSTKIVFKALG